MIFTFYLPHRHAVKVLKFVLNHQPYKQKNSNPTLVSVISFSGCRSKCLAYSEFSAYIRDATQRPGKSPIFSPLKIGGGREVNPDFGKIETKDSNFRDQASVSWEN